MTKPLLQPRQLRFRVWDRDRMVLVHTLSFNDGGMMWHGPSNKMGWGWLDETCTSWNDTHNPKPNEHDVSPVMQWSGLADESGVLIYEGDIVAFGSKNDPSYGLVRLGEFDDSDGYPQEGWFVEVPYVNEANVTAKHALARGNGYRVAGDVYTTPKILKFR